ncbi:MAG: hypothetical protein AAF844_05295 [Pseudomonadota bacterium]
MKTLKTTGISYDDRYFDEETLLSLVAGRLCPPGASVDELALGMSPLGMSPLRDARMAFREACCDLADSTVLALALNVSECQRDAMFAEAVRRQWRGTAGEDADCPPIGHDVTVTLDGAIEHRIDDTLVLVLPGTLAAREDASERIGFAVAQARLAVDALVLLTASCGVDVALLVPKRAETVRFVLQQYGGAILLHAPPFAHDEAAVRSSHGSAGEARLLTVLGFVRRATTPLWIAERLLADLPPAERGRAALDLLFNLRLTAMRCSGRAAMLRRIPALPRASRGFIDALADAVGASRVCPLPPQRMEAVAAAG